MKPRALFVCVAGRSVRAGERLTLWGLESLLLNSTQFYPTNRASRSSPTFFSGDEASSRKTLRLSAFTEDAKPPTNMRLRGSFMLGTVSGRRGTPIRSPSRSYLLHVNESRTSKQKQITFAFPRLRGRRARLLTAYYGSRSTAVGCSRGLFHGLFHMQAERAHIPTTVYNLTLIVNRGIPSVMRIGASILGPWTTGPNEAAATECSSPCSRLSQ